MLPTKWGRRGVCLSVALIDVRRTVPVIDGDGPSLSQVNLVIDTARCLAVDDGNRRGRGLDWDTGGLV